MNLSELLSEPVVSAFSPPKTNENYQKLVAYGNVHSYSQQQIFHACPRKWAIKKLEAFTGTHIRTSSPTFAFGHAVGAAVAEYDRSHSRENAMMAAFLSWDIDLLAEDPKPTGKTYAAALAALEHYIVFLDEELTLLQDFETVNVEATIAVDLENGHFYVGHIDELLRSKSTGRFLVKENKTTGLRTIDPAMYANSDQALSYAIAVDMLGGAEYDVLYTVYSSSQERWLYFPFVKTPAKKAAWLQDQLIIASQVDQYSDLNFFPKRGGACFSFMRRCEFFETCDMKDRVRFGLEFTDLPRVVTRDQIEAIEKVDYFTTVSEIVARQRQGLK